MYIWAGTAWGQNSGSRLVRKMDNSKVYFFKRDACMYVGSSTVWPVTKERFKERDLLCLALRCAILPP